MAKKKKQQQPKFNAVWIYVPLLIMIGYMYFFGANSGDPVKTEWLKVKEQMIPQGDVEKITFVTNQNLAEVTIKTDMFWRKVKFGKMDQNGMSSLITTWHEAVKAPKINM